MNNRTIHKMCIFPYTCKNTRYNLSATIYTFLEHVDPITITSGIFQGNPLNYTLYIVSRLENSLLSHAWKVPQVIFRRVPLVVQ